MKYLDELKAFDPEIFEACNDELTRQQNNIELIASENIVSNVARSSFCDVGSKLAAIRTPCLII